MPLCWDRSVGLWKHGSMEAWNRGTWNRAMQPWIRTMEPREVYVPQWMLDLEAKASFGSASLSGNLISLLDE